MSPADDAGRPIGLAPRRWVPPIQNGHKSGGERMSESGTDADCPGRADGTSRGGIGSRASGPVETETSAVRHPRW